MQPHAPHYISILCKQTHVFFFPLGGGKMLAVLVVVAEAVVAVGGAARNIFCATLQPLQPSCISPFTLN